MYLSIDAAWLHHQFYKELKLESFYAVRATGL